MEPKLCPFCGGTELNAANDDSNPTDSHGNLLTEYQCDTCGQVFWS